MVPSLRTRLRLYYADDLVVYKIITDPGITPLGSLTNSVADWLSLNSLKCRCMTVTRLQQHSVSPPMLLLNGEPMEKVNSYKYLGVQVISLGQTTPEISQLRLGQWCRKMF